MSFHKDGKKMTADVGALRRNQGTAYARMCRDEWPKHTRKLAAKALGVTEATISKLLSGEQPPSADLLTAGFLYWGAKFVADVIVGSTGQTERSEWQIQAELQEIRAKLDRIEAGYQTSRPGSGA